MSRKNTSQRVSGRKKRKLHDDDSDEISLTSNLDLFKDSCLEVNKTSQKSFEGHLDLFGEVIPPDVPVSNEEAKNKPIKKTRKKKKQPYEELFDTPSRPQKVFIHTGRFFKVMMEAQKELYSLMGVPMSSSKVPVVSTGSLNVSGVQHIQDSPQISISNESKIKSENKDNCKEPHQILEGKLKFFINIKCFIYSYNLYK